MRYPKLTLLSVSVLLAYVFFYLIRNYSPVHDYLTSLGWVGIFLGGIFYAYGFTAAPATAILLILAKQQNVILAGLAGGMGALLSDIVMFKFIRHSFMEEIERLQQEKLVVAINRITGDILGKFRVYLIPVTAAVLIASPLPTEMGVSILASDERMSAKRFVLMAYLLHTLGILIVLIIGNNI